MLKIILISMMLVGIMFNACSNTPKSSYKNSSAMYQMQLSEKASKDLN